MNHGQGLWIKRSSQTGYLFLCFSNGTSLVLENVFFLCQCRHAFCACLFSFLFSVCRFLTLNQDQCHHVVDFIGTRNTNFFQNKFFHCSKALGRQWWWCWYKIIRFQHCRELLEQMKKRRECCCLWLACFYGLVWLNGEQNCSVDWVDSHLN